MLYISTRYQPPRLLDMPDQLNGLNEAVRALYDAFALALSSELGQVLGDSDGREAARLWRLKQLEYSFRLTAMSRYEDFRWVTSRALDFALASVGARVPGEQAQRLVELYDHLQPFPDAVPALRALVGDRKSTRLNSSHSSISYAVFCLKKKNK